MSSQGTQTTGDAGRTGGASARRGSFLVLVVGTLALLAVITIVYVALGNQDARTRQAVLRRDELDVAPDVLRDYILGIVGDDATATTFDGTFDRLGNPIFRRETTDTTSTLWDRVTNSTNPKVKFDPVGTVPDEYLLSPGDVPADYVLGPSDPWLASLKPVFLNYDFLSRVGNGAGRVAPSTTDPLRAYLDAKDWFQISNIAPDGAFVNLANLRPENAGFRATPLQMRNNLSLLEADGTPTSTTDFGLNAASGALARAAATFGMRQRGAYRPAVTGPDDPVDATSLDYRDYQWADADGDGMLDSRWFELVDASNPQAVEDLAGIPGKYRWFFATRIVDLSGLVNVNTATDLTASPLLPGGRALPVGLTPADIDLYRLLIQNDFFNSYDPSPSNALVGYRGLSNAGLAAADSANYEKYSEAEAFLSGGMAYATLRLSVASGRVPGASDAENNFVFTENPYTMTGPADSGIVQYAELEGLWRATSPNRDFTGPWMFAPYPPVSSIRAENLPADGELAFPARRAAFYLQQSARVLDTTLTDPTGIGLYSFAGSFGVGDAGELLTRHGINDSAVASTLELALGGRNSGEGAASLRFDPLRSNRPTGVELVAFDDYNEPPDVVPARGSPRDQAFMRAASDVRSLLTTVSSARDFRNVLLFPDANGRLRGIDPFQLGEAERKIDVRATLDLWSSRAASVLYSGYADGLAFFSPAPMWSSTGETPGEPDRTLFYGQRGPQLALTTAAHMAVNMADLRDGPAPAVTAPTGSREVASPITRVFDDNGRLREIHDPFDKPTMRTVVFSPAMRGILNGTDPDLERVFPSWEKPTGSGSNARAGDNLDRPDEQLARRMDDTVVPAVNVYGVEAQPFLTQVVTMSVYSGEAEPSGTGVEVTIDDDTLNVGQANNNGRSILYRMVAFTLTNPFDRDVRLSSKLYSDVDPSRYLSGGNPIDPWTNPAAFNRGDTISLTGANQLTDRVDRMRDFYYVRFGDKTYMLAALKQQRYITSAQAGAGATGIANDAEAGRFVKGGDAAPITGDPDMAPTVLDEIVIPAGKTVVCYALSEAPSKILARLRSSPFNYAVPAGIADADLIERVLTQNIGQGATDVEGVYWIPLLDANTTFPVTDTQPDGPAIQDVTLVSDPVPTSPGLRGVASLWRVMRHGDEDDFSQGGGVNAPGSDWTGAPLDPLGTLPSDLPPPNDYTNDMLVDRMRMPNVDVDVKLAASVTLTTGLTGVAVGDDLTFTRWASVRRPFDPRVTAAAGMPVGLLPGYCVEPKYWPPGDDIPGGQTEWNFFAQSSPLPASSATFAAALVNTDGVNYDGASKTIGEWIQSMGNVNPTTGALVTPARFVDNGRSATAPSRLAGTRYPAGGTRDAASVDKGGWNGTAGLSYNIPFLSYAELAPRLPVGTGWFYTNAAPDTEDTAWVSTLRLGDLLSPLGIGPMEAPVERDGRTIRDPADPNQFNYRYTTLGEAVAIATGIEDFVPGADAWDFDPALRMSPWSVDDSGTRMLTETEPVAQNQLPDPTDNNRQGALATDVLLFDRGNLWLDKFAPYFDFTPSFGDERFEFFPGFGGAGGDVRAGLGVPSALACLDNFIVLPRMLRGEDPVQDTRESLTRGRVGLVNINTAPVEVLRALPLASPKQTYRVDPPPPGAAVLPPREYGRVSIGQTFLREEPDWIARNISTTAARRPGGALFMGSYPTGAGVQDFGRSNDFGAAIAAYRDQITVGSRPARRGNANLPYAIAFQDSDPSDPFAFGRADRAYYTEIEGIHDQPGFRTVGELFAVRSRVEFNRTPVERFGLRLAGNTTRPFPSSVHQPFNADALGTNYSTAAGFQQWNDTALELEPYGGADAVATRNGKQFGITNDYQEKLSVVNSLINTVSTRSDVFAAWFIVAGFQESDVAELARPENAQQPLVASVKRRFLMIIDRSNVTRRGDRPKVLLFKEVAM